MEHGKLSVKGFAISAAILWGAGVFLVGIGSLLQSGYGEEFLEVISSVYPGYEADETIGSVFVGTIYALLDGLIGGALLAFFYNKLTSKK